MRPAPLILGIILLTIGTCVTSGCTPQKVPTVQLLKQADRSFDYGQWSDAAAKYEEVLAREPHEGPIQYRFGLCQLELGDYSKAESALEIAQSLDPRDDEITYALAEALFNKKQYTRLFTMLRDRARDNRSVDTWLVMADYAEKLDDFDTAMEALSNACAIEDGSTYLPYYRAAVLLGRVGQSDEAIRRLRQAYAIAPDDEAVNVMLVEYGEIPGPTLGLAPGR